MAVYPLIDSPCPWKGRLNEIMKGDTCTLCHRQVHDLTSMSGAQRRAFLKSCGGEVCVSYRVAAGTAIALGALAAAAVASPPAAAQPDPTEPVVWIIVGGIKDGAKAVLVEDESDKTIPELPVVFEPATSGAKPAPAARPEANPPAGGKDVK
jgi:hypothetical protein